jgi:hypothetical protein
MYCKSTANADAVDVIGRQWVSSTVFGTFQPLHFKKCRRRFSGSARDTTATNNKVMHELLDWYELLCANYL